MWYAATLSWEVNDMHYLSWDSQSIEMHWENSCKHFQIVHQPSVTYSILGKTETNEQKHILVIGITQGKIRCCTMDNLLDLSWRYASLKHAHFPKRMY